ncbi:MAG: hypothetical protein AB1627_08040 [Chloroflexota bacterium]
MRDGASAARREAGCVWALRTAVSEAPSHLATCGGVMMIGSWSAIAVISGFVAARNAHTEYLCRVNRMLTRCRSGRLAERADVIALIQPLGDPRIHWNNAANEPWETDEIGTVSHLYRDQSIHVVQVLKGTLDAKEIMLRGLGGTLGDY